jgi:lipopolysaccharide exporter
LIKKILKSDFLKSTLTLTSGTTLSQAISILTAPILTRIFLPAEYDVLGIYLMVTGILGALVTMQSHNIIVTEENDEIAEKVVSLSVYISIAVSLAALVLIGVIDLFSFKWYEEKYSSAWYYLIPVSLLFNGWNMTFSSLAVRKKEFKALSFNKIIAAIFVPVFSISLGLLVKGPAGLIIGLLISQSVATVLLGNRFLSRYQIQLFLRISEVRQLLFANRGFIKYAVPSETMNGIVYQLPVIMIAAFYNAPGVIGNFNLSNRMLSMPVQLISTSILDVFRQKASKEYGAKKECRSTYIKTFLLLFGSSLLPFLILLFFAPYIFKIVFGSNWELAGTFSQIMAPFFFLKFIVSPLSYMFYIAGRQKEDFIAHIIMSIAVFLSFFICRFYSSDVLVSLVAYTTVYSIIYIYYLIRSYKFSKGS